jgi:hypothetical protein
MTIIAGVTHQGRVYLAAGARLRPQDTAFAASVGLATLPVLRRVLASGAIRHDSLPEAFRRRGELQRKHLLRTLAVEAGFESWEAWRPTPSLSAPRAACSRCATPICR